MLRVEGISYLVCATQRSGSTLLCELLKGTEVAGVPDEYFEALRATGLPRQPRQYFEDAAVADIADAARRRSIPGRPEQPGEFEGWFAYALQRGTTPQRRVRRQDDVELLRRLPRRGSRSSPGSAS